MKKSIFFAVTLSTSLPVIAQDLDAATKDVCKCLEQPYAMLEEVLSEISTAQAQGDYDALLAKQGEMTEAVNSSTACFDGLPAKYPKINADPAL